MPTRAWSTAVHPNFIVILADDLDLRLGTLQYMPNIQRRLARRGLIFTNFFVNVSLCCPSRTSLLRGQYVHNHGVYTNSGIHGGFDRAYKLGIEQNTLATALQNGGYETALLGKYLNGYPLGATLNYIPSGWTHWMVPNGGDPYAGYNYDLNIDGVQEHHGSDPKDYLIDVMSAHTQALIKEAKEPFFFYVAPFAPHIPATPPLRYRHAFAKLKAKRLPSWNEADVSDKPPHIAQLPLLRKADVQQIDHLYRQRLRSMAAVDDLVGAIIDSLNERGSLDQTYIIFTSDNGFHLGEHRLPKGKYLPYEEDVHVPLYIVGPGLIAGATRDGLASMVDLAPTIASLAGTHLALEPDGRSLVPLFSSTIPPKQWRQQVLLEQYPMDENPGTPRAKKKAGPEPHESKTIYPLGGLTAYFGLRTQRYKYVEYEHTRFGKYLELYDLYNDPYELNNLAKKAPAWLLQALARRLSLLRDCKGAECRQIDGKAFREVQRSTP